MSNIMHQRRTSFIDRAVQISNATHRANLPLTSDMGTTATISRRANATLLTALRDTQARLFGSSTTGRAPSNIAARHQASLLTQLATIEARARQLSLI